MAASRGEVQGSKKGGSDRGPAPQKRELDDKAVGLLLKYLEQTLQQVDRSILIAFTTTAVLLIPGLQGTFAVGVREEAVAKIPYLNIEAQVLTVALFGLVLFWVFCFRAASQYAGAREIVDRLRSGEADALVEAALHYPSIATSTQGNKRFICISLALLGVLSWLLIYVSPLGLESAAYGSLAMAIPPFFLLYKVWTPLDSPAAGDRRGVSQSGEQA